MSGDANPLALDPRWLAAQRAGADLPPRRPRLPLWAGPALIGSAEPDLFDGLQLPALPGGEPVLEKTVRPEGVGWQLRGEATTSLALLAHALRDAGLAHVWRNEQLAVTHGPGDPVGTIERAVVRPLGITTRAVHLIGRAPDGRHWIQQRALSKANDPGLWDTLMGGMISAADSLDTALERETWEEAGLRLEALAALAWGGRVTTRRPSGEAGGRGYVIEHIDWYRCTVPAGMSPVNQDGEVAQFALMGDAEVAARMQRGEFTTEAVLILAQAAGL